MPPLPASSSSSGEMWGLRFLPSTVDVSFLLPTGIFIQLECQRDETLAKIKEKLWEKASRCPLSEQLKESRNYIFAGVNLAARREQYCEESLRLCDLRLFQPIIRVVEPIGDQEETILTRSIDVAIGSSISDLDHCQDLEVVDFRRNLLGLCKQSIEKRECSDDVQRILAYYPPDIESSPENCADYLKEFSSPSKDALFNIDPSTLESHMTIRVWAVHLESEKQPKQNKRLRIPFYAKLKDVLNTVLYEYRRSFSDLKLDYNHSSSYVLQIYGFDDYLIDESLPLFRYKYVRRCLSCARMPEFLLVSKQKLFESVPKCRWVTPSFVQRGLIAEEHRTKESRSIWDHRGKVTVYVRNVTYFKSRDFENIFVKMGVYLGTEPLHVPLDTEERPFNDPRWNQHYEYENLFYSDLPRNARLCLAVCCRLKKSKKRESENEIYVLGWFNLNLFDHRGVFVAGLYHLQLWPAEKNTTEILYPNGTSGANWQQLENAHTIDIEFHNSAKYELVFPAEDAINMYCSRLEQDTVHSRGTTAAVASSPASSANLKDLKAIVSRDSTELSEQDKLLLRQCRRDCAQHLPDSLPKVLQAVKWSDHQDVCAMYCALRQWPMTLNVDTAFELLDVQYGDGRVRDFAVRCLFKKLRDDQWADYMLQLVQVLKYEQYLDNSLGRALLVKALMSRRLGFQFFWCLRSELAENNHKNFRFQLMLEAFCRGSTHYLTELCRQVDAMNRLEQLSAAIKELKDDNQRTKVLLEHLNRETFRANLENFLSPLNCAIRFGSLLLDRCRVMSSAKKPLWLSWSNPFDVAPGDEHDEAHNDVIFKNGDDLRQDMLTLQLIRLMDTMWRTEGMDLKITPYTALATGSRAGLIEVVKRARTVYKVQSQGGMKSRFQFDNLLLFRWMEKQGDRAEKMIENFTLSCAAYCVATFVLGIGDRHPDNIMLNHEGRVFHIDFGHFLGHFKTKLGIRRERVPFVLTSHFTCIIARGEAVNAVKTKEFEQFQRRCEEAYKVLRKNAHMLSTLLSMMMHADLPELQNQNDVGYLTKTLQMGRSDDTALTYFKDQFSEATEKWSTKIDWIFHGLKHGTE